MSNTDLIIYTSAFFVLVFFGLFIRSLLKKESVRYLAFELGGCIAFIIPICALAIPGSESNFELGPIKYKFKTPSEAAKLIGDKKKIFEARNTDKKNPKPLVFSASSTSQTVSPNLNFLVGKEYIKDIYVSKDGKEQIFNATLPPGKEIKTATSSQVSVNVWPTSSADDNRKKEILREIFGLENHK